MYKDQRIISLGNFLFKYRNFIFPLTIVILFVAIPPANSFMNSSGMVAFKDKLALVVTCLGLAIRASVIGFAYIKRGGLNKQVYADDLVTTGIFAICRNPLYVGNVIIYLGIFIMHGNMNVIVFGTLLFVFVYISLIAAEENFLSKKFGAQFDEYCAKTPRWVPDLMGLSKAIEGMSFDYKKVMLKDYTTIANTFFALICIKLYELAIDEKNYTAAGKVSVLIPLFIVALVVIKKYKKKESLKNSQ